MHVTLLVALGAPLVLVALFGLYSAAVILHGIVTFPECPQAYEDLKKDIQRARAQLSARGFSQW